LKDKLLFYLGNPIRLITVPLSYLPFFSFIRKTSDYQGHINFDMWFKQKVINVGGNRKAYWPVHWTSKVYDVENILVGVDAYPGIMNGCYIQGKGGIEIGDYTQIAPNVVIVSANHDMYDLRNHIDKPVKIGRYCWIGAGASIMPGVTIGDWTIVASGAVVTKSFPEGYCMIAGVPATVVKELDKEKCIPYQNKHLYHGFIRADKFPSFRKKKLKI